MLVDGEWRSGWRPVDATDADGGFVRQASTFRNWVTPDGEAGPTGAGGFKAEPGRYHLYVSLACPWASRTLVGRALKGLDQVISVSVVEPAIGDQGWTFGEAAGADRTSLDGDRHLHQVYTRADPQVSGRATVPVLWDKHRHTIVNNESADILRMLSTGFGRLATTQADLYPEELADEIDRFAESIYSSLNNGVYRAGFAGTQRAYEQAAHDVFTALDTVEHQLSDRRPFIFGGEVTEADIRLFVTEVRFDAAYHGVFKTNIRRLQDYPRLSEHLERMLKLPGVGATVNVDHIKEGYHSIRALNPSGLVSVGPFLPWAQETSPLAH